MSTPFDYIKSVINTKTDLIDNEELFEKEYVSFIVNRGLSNDETCCLFSNEMNCYPSLSKKLQYHFFLYGIPKSKKYVKWVKKEKDLYDKELIDVICEAYGCSQLRANEIINILGVEQIKAIRTQYGGKTNGKTSRD